MTLPNDAYKTIQPEETIPERPGPDVAEMFAAQDRDNALRLGMTPNKRAELARLELMNHPSIRMTPEQRFISDIIDREREALSSGPRYPEMSKDDPWSSINYVKPPQRIEPVPVLDSEPPLVYNYITNIPGEIQNAHPHDKVLYIPSSKKDRSEVVSKYGVDTLDMPFDYIPDQPSEEDLAFFEKRERFKGVIAERLGIDPSTIAKQAEKDYLNRFPAEQRTPQVYAAAANHGRQARIEAEKSIDPYLKMFDERLKKDNGNQTVEQLTARALRGDKEAQSVLDAMKKRQIEIAQAGQGSFKELPFDSQELYYEQYYRTKTIPPFAYRDAQSRNAFIQGFSEWAKRNNIQGADVVAQRAEVDALTKSQANQEKVRGMMGGFVRNINKQVDRVDAIGKDLVSRVGVRALDLPIRELKTRFAGSGQERVLESYLMEISNEIGKLSTGSSASIAELSAEAQKRWSGVHDPNLSINELKKILDATREQANMRITSSDEELKYTRERLGGGKKTGESPTQARNTAPLVTWFKAHSNFDSKALYDEAIKSGWQPEEIKQAWRVYRGR